MVVCHRLMIEHNFHQSGVKRLVKMNIDLKCSLVMYCNGVSNKWKKRNRVKSYLVKIRLILLIGWLVRIGI